MIWYMYIYSHNCLYFNFKHAQQSGLCGHYVLCVGVLKGSCSAPLDMWCLWRYPCLEWFTFQQVLRRGILLDVEMRVRNS